MTGSGDRRRVAAVVVTRNRPEPLAATLASLEGQEPPLDRIVVVDSGSDDGPPSLGSGIVPVDVVDAGDNVGFGAALAVGMRHVGSDRVDWIWLLDDDSPVAPGSLRRALDTVAAHPDVAVLANRGGFFRHGRIHHVGARGPVPFGVDFCLVDGTLVSRRVVEAVGVPRSDLFMMFEDFDYSTRVVAAGFEVAVSDAVRSTPMHLGSSASAAPSLTRWRLYYQSRNHLRIMLERRSVVGVAGWALREAKILVFAARDRREPWHLARLLGRSVLDAVRGRMGRTIDPPVMN